MGKPDRRQNGDRIFPVFLWIFLAATVAILLILVGAVLKRNGTWERRKQSHEETATKKEETANYHTDGKKENTDAEGNVGTQGCNADTEESKEVTEPKDLKDPLRQALTKSPVNGSEVWWKDAVKIENEVTVYAIAEVPLYASPGEEKEPVGRTVAAEPFCLFAVLADGWYVVGDGRFYYCSKGNNFTLVKTEPYVKEEVFSDTGQSRVEHKVSSILQTPELPHGCEVTGLAMLLSYYGVSADKCALADNWLPKGSWGKTDFRKAFVGDPRTKKASAGCYAAVIADTANRYLAENGGGLTAESREGVGLRELLSMLEEEPILVWTTMRLQAPYIAQIWTMGEEELYWQNYEHCVVLTGYDREQGVLYGNDPLYGPQEYDAELFFLRFQTMFSQVVRLRKKTNS